MSRPLRIEYPGGMVPCDGPGQALCYRELNERANQLAHVIREKYRRLWGEEVWGATLIGLYVDWSAIEARLFNRGTRGYVLDGDNILYGLNSDLGLSPENRQENIRRIAEVAKLMVASGLLVFAAFIAPYRESSGFVQNLMADFLFYECYVKCSAAQCEKRDPKGLPKKARIHFCEHPLQRTECITISMSK